MTPLAQRELEAETQRQQAWAIFVASLRDYAHRTRWCRSQLFAVLMDAADDEAGDSGAVECEIRAFAGLYGWPDTLRAVAQALEADETQQRELEARR